MLMFNQRIIIMFYIQKCTFLHGYNDEKSSIDLDNNNYEIFHYSKKVKESIHKSSKKKYHYRSISC